MKVAGTQPLGKEKLPKYLKPWTVPTYTISQRTNTNRIRRKLGCVPRESEQKEKGIQGAFLSTSSESFDSGRERKLG